MAKYSYWIGIGTVLLYERLGGYHVEHCSEPGPILFPPTDSLRMSHWI